MDLELLKGHWNNWAWMIVVYLDEFCTFVPDTTWQREDAIDRSQWMSYRSLRDFVQRKANKPKSLYSCKKKKKKTVHELLKRHWGVSIVVYSLIWTNPFDDLSSRAIREWINVVSTRSTGFRTNKRYAILLELPVTPAFDIWYILADILRCPHNEVKISQRWSLIRDGNYQLYWCWKVKLKVGCYNLMLAAKVECWGLKLIFGSLSWIINFECWNVKLKVECYNLMLAGQVECWGLKLIFGGDWTPYLPTDTVLYDGDSG